MKNEENIDEIQLEKRKRALFSVKTIPWFIGFSNDLMFYIAINTLFLTTVKHLTASQISLLTTVSLYIFTKTFFENNKENRQYKIG